LAGQYDGLYAGVIGSLPNLYLVATAPRSSPIADLVTVNIQNGGLFDQQYAISGFNGVKPNGAGSPFPYGFNVEPDR